MALNENVLIIREKTIQFCKMYERIIMPVMKFILVLYSVLQINMNIGYAAILVNPYVIFGMALVCMVIPTGWILPVLMIVVVMHLMAFSTVMGGLALALFIVLYILFIRFYPKESIWIVITMLAMKLGIAYVIPIAVPLVVGMNYLIPIVIGVVMYEVGIQLTVLIQNNMIVGEIQEILLTLLGFIQNNVILNPKTLATAGIFAIVFIIVSIIRRLNIDYAGYMAIAIGAVMNLLGFGIAVLFLEIELSVLILVIMTILSAVIAVVVQYLSCVVDYNRAETVQFEDDDNVYYVKVIPKIKINANKTKIEQVYTGTVTEDLDQLSNDIY
ncbi:MAG: hypothetical protein ACRCW2_07325 [Cellulosilyticaceae bacterium]